VGKKKGVCKCLFKMLMSRVLLEELGGHIFIFIFSFEKMFIFFDLLEDLGVHIFLFFIYDCAFFFGWYHAIPKME
jgi:hypothetical protein